MLDSFADAPTVERHFFAVLIRCSDTVVMYAVPAMLLYSWCQGPLWYQTWRGRGIPLRFALASQLQNSFKASFGMHFFPSESEVYRFWSGWKHRLAFFCLGSRYGRFLRKRAFTNTRSKGLYLQCQGVYCLYQHPPTGAWLFFKLPKASKKHLLGRCVYINCDGKKLVWSFQNQVEVHKLEDSYRQYLSSVHQQETDSA